MRVLVLSLQIAVLVEGKVLDDYIKQRKQKRRDPTLKLHRFVASLLHHRVLANINACTPGTTVYPFLVPGFSSNSAQQVLNFIYLERSPFLAARISNSGEWDGWLTLFYGLQGSLRHDTTYAIQSNGLWIIPTN